MTPSRRIITSPIWNCRELVVDAPGGSVSYDGLSIHLHSPLPLYGDIDEIDEAGDCHVLPGQHCFTDSVGLAAQKLKAAWMAAGKDDAVIWAELERRAARFEA